VRRAGQRPARRLEARQIGALEDAAARQIEPLWIDLLAIAQDFVMQMRAGRAAAGADIADHLPLLDPFAALDATRIALEMGIGGLVGAVMADPDIMPEGAVAARPLDHAPAGAIDRRAARSGEVGAAMHLGIAQNWVPPAAEAR